MMMKVLSDGILIISNGSHILSVTLFHAVLLDCFSHFGIVVAWLFHTLIPGWGGGGGGGGCFPCCFCFFFLPQMYLFI